MQCASVIYGTVIEIIYVYLSEVLLLFVTVIKVNIKGENQFFGYSV